MGSFAADGSLTVLLRIYSEKKEILENIIRAYKLNLRIQKDRNKFFIRTSHLFSKELDLLKKRFGLGYSYTYLFQIIDSDKTAVETIREGIRDLFGIDTKIKNERGAWSLRIYSKILARYFRLLGFSYGKKVETVHEPDIIKDQNLEIRRAFARGVLTFDGSVKYSGEVYMTLKSKHLIKDIGLILTKLKIKNFITNKRDLSSIYIDKDDSKVLSLFILNTRKWYRLKSSLGGFKKRVNSVEEAKSILFESYDKYNRLSVDFRDLINYLQDKNEFRSSDKIEILGKKNTAFYTKLRMLDQMKIITSKKILIRDTKGRFIEKYKKYTFNDNVKTWRLPNC